MRFLQYAFAVSLAVILGACASAAVTPPAIAPNHPVTTAGFFGHVPVRVPASVLNIWHDAPSGVPRGRSFVADPNATGQLIYGCLLERAACVWFAKGRDKIIGQISGLGTPNSVGVDPRNGDLLVADTGGQQILVYPPNSITRLATIADAGQFVVDVAVDGGGNIYAASLFDSSGNPGSVQVFDPNGNLVRTLTDSSVQEGFSVSVDEHKDVSFCFMNFGGVGQCDDFLGAREPAVERASGWGFTGGSSFDREEHLSVIDQLVPAVLSYSGSTQCGSATLAGASDPVGLALDRRNRLLYASDDAVGLIDAYPFADCANGTLSAVKVYGKAIGQGSGLTGVAVTPGVRP